VNEGSPLRPRVLIADDHAVVAEGFARLLAPHYDVVGIVGDGREVLVAAPRLLPDVVLLDIAMPHLDGLNACRKLKHLVPSIRVVILTLHGEGRLAAEALRAGAVGFVVKTDRAAVLLEALAAAMRGETFVSPSISLPKEVDGSTRDRVAGLTPRQREVLQLLARGLATKQVARELDISTHTVSFHKYRIMKRHGIDSTAGLVRLAVQEGLIVAPPPA